MTTHKRPRRNNFYKIPTPTQKCFYTAYVENGDLAFSYAPQESHSTIKVCALQVVMRHQVINVKKTTGDTFVDISLATAWVLCFTCATPFVLRLFQLAYKCTSTHLIHFFLFTSSNRSIAYRSIVRGICDACARKKSSSTCTSRFPTSRNIQPVALCMRS